VGWWYVLHTLMSLQHVSKATQSSHLCILFLGSRKVCLTAWITGAWHTVLQTSLLIASTRNEKVPITVAARHPPSYKYLIRSPLGTISHSFSLSLPRLVFSSLVLCGNGGQERHEARTLPFHGGKSCGQRHQDPSAGTIWNSITSRIPGTSVLPPPSLAGTWVGWPLRDGSSGGSILTLGWGEVYQ
jgi:hypothetical protein